MIGAVAVFLAAIGIFTANRTCERATEGKVYSSLDTVPVNEVGLVLGTSKMTKKGIENPHFDHRIEAAAALYKAGKVKHLLVSGDNHIKTYNEPDDMRAALIAAGVPAAAITCDYAGFRTLDSVVRAKEVFGLQRCTIISEEFHCPRAVWIAQQHRLDAVAYAAPDVSKVSWALRAQVREELARTWCAVDLYVWHRGPRFLGPKEVIGVS